MKGKDIKIAPQFILMFFFFLSLYEVGTKAYKARKNDIKLPKKESKKLFLYFFNFTHPLSSDL